MSVVLPKEKEIIILSDQSEIQDYSEIKGFLEQIRNFQIPTITHFSPYSLSLFDLRNDSLANIQNN